jgi:hypothetical protein
MPRQRLTIALSTLAIVAIAGVAIAQDADARRERLRRAAGAAVEVAGGLIDREANAAVLPQIDGRVIILQRVEKKAKSDAADAKPADELKEINVGGLVIVEVPDTQSHPTNVELPKATPEGSLEPLGKVRGIRTNNEGEPMMGGGYTWFLFKPATVGSAMLNVKYTPNGGGDPVDQTYELNIVETK